ncbi:hypothetical protein LTR66_001007 [Elasticomyces elasticus]|nr:hypothetical protein LTR66_001007 [Elasticomyces elasticus]
MDRIGRLNSTLNAITVVAKDAIEQAQKLDEAFKKTGKLVGPLHGIPIVIKDQIETAGMVTTFGSKLAANFVPREDAHLVKLLRDAGAVILAKTTMPDWAAAWFSTSSATEVTFNPYDLSRDPGGSSSGTGAAVAANLALVGIGGDTGGSIRLPSSFCNLVGVRVTPGRISRHGMSALVTTQDTPGPMTRSVEDAARLLDVLVGFDEKDNYTSVNVIAQSLVTPERSPSFLTAVAPPPFSWNNRPLEGKTFGVLRAAFGAHKGIIALMNTTTEGLARLGAQVVDVEIPDLDHYKTYTSSYGTRSRSDINEFLAARKSPDLPETLDAAYEAKVWHPALDLIPHIMQGPPNAVDDGAFASRLLAQTEFQRVVVSVFAKQKLDAMLYPTCQVPAPTTRDVVEGRWTCLTFPTNTVIASQLLFPAISVPVGFVEAEENGAEVPVGMEILGLPYGEAKILAVAAATERMAQARKLPPLK